MASKTKQDSVITYILIGRCECDEMVAFPFFWAEDLIPYARERKFDIVDLKRKRFCKEQVKKHIEDKNPTLIFLNGHGDENSVRGYNQEPVITLYENDYLLKGKTAHILSCDNGKFLAQSCIDKGCKGFLGYDGLFHIETDYNPKKDEHLQSPCIFFGIYKRKDINVINNHKSDKIIVWTGTDVLNFKKKNIIYKLYFKNLINNPQIKHIAISSYIYNDLQFLGLKPHRVTFSLADPERFKPVQLGPKVYIYTSKKSPNNYGKKIYQKVIAALPEIEFIVANHSSYKDVYEAYKQCFIGLRLTCHDGNANTVQELGLCGIKCIHNGDSPNAIPFRGVDDIVRNIKKEQEKIGTINHELANLVREHLMVGKEKK